jgi:hypothetical protein
MLSNHRLDMIGTVITDGCKLFDPVNFAAGA